jgi:hypothetical protein
METKNLRSMFANTIIRSGQSLAMIRNMMRQQVEYNKKMGFTGKEEKVDDN